MYQNNENSVILAAQNTIIEEKLTVILQYASGIRPPSQIPTPGKLFEMSASATNSRSIAMPPPANTLKRKTLAERAGETARPAPAPPNSRTVNAHVRATSIAGASRETSFSSSVASSRPSSSASSRNISNSSYGSSIGPGNRPPSTQFHRSQSAMANPRTQKNGSISARPATSLEVHEEEVGTERIPSKRKGRVPSSSNITIRPPKNRQRCDSHLDNISSWEARPFNAVTPREISLCTHFDNAMNLNGDSSQAAPIAEVQEHSISSVARPAPIAETGVPKTPSHIPKLAPRPALAAETPSPTKSPKKKASRQFLTRDTNTLSAFDTESRMDDMENMFSQMKEKVDSAATERESLKEAMSMYKIRSMFASPCW